MDAHPCPDCGAAARDVPGWCRSCGRHDRVAAVDLLTWLVPGAVEIIEPTPTPDPLGWDGYDDALEQARERSSESEAVVVVRGQVGGDGSQAVFVAWEFDFLGGSIGTVAGESIARAYEAAADAGLPIVLLPSTGGARMQEGMASLVQMATTSVAAARHAEDGLLQVAVLRDPTTGGVFASHANQAHVVLAEPGATIGFAGPRVAEAMTGGALPEGSHTAEGALAAGLVDAVVARGDLRATLDQLLGWATTSATPEPVEAPVADRLGPADAWTEVQRARDPRRPRAAAFLGELEVAFELRGDRAGTDDPAVRVVLADLAGRRIVLVALDRAGNDGSVTAAGYRKAWRGFGLASQLGVPLVTLVDTPGADASGPAEAGGIAHHMSWTFRRLLDVGTPTVALVIGEGGSGGALALAVCDRLLIQEHAIFSVIAPEGAAAILHRDRSRAPEVAAQLQPTAQKLAQLGIADEVVPEPVGAEVPAAWAAVARHLDELAQHTRHHRLEARRERWRRGWSQP